MEVGPYVLPGLGMLMVAVLIYATAAWVFDGTKPEEDIAFLDPETEKNDRRSDRKPASRR